MPVGLRGAVNEPFGCDGQYPSGHGFVIVLTFKWVKVQAMRCTLKAIVNLYQSNATRTQAGEPVTPLAHAWQCGRLAEKSGASLPLQLASWLHDVGHLCGAGSVSPAMGGEEAAHENTGANLLLQTFGQAVSEPVRWHVQAKRYLVTNRPNYAKKLSPNSLRSLALQGGQMSAEDCHAFEKNPFFVDSLKLRVWDDLAKSTSWFDVSPDEALAHLSALMEAVAAKNVTKI